MSKAIGKHPAETRIAWSVLLVAAVYLATLAVMPRRGMWIVDNENRFLQTAALARGGFGSYAIPWAGHDLDPRFTMNPLRFDPEGTFQPVKGDQLVAAFQPTFMLVSALPYRALGPWGLYLWPLGGAVLMLAGVARLAAALRLRRSTQHLAVLLAGLATPAWFYSQTFWEHTTAAACAVWGVVFAVRHLESRSSRQLVAAFAWLGAALLFRDVLGLFAVIVLALLAWRSPGARLRTALVGGAVLLAGVLLLLALQWATIGRPLGFHAGTLLGEERGLLAYLRARPALLYLYLVNAHPDRALSFVLAAPFLLALIARPRVPAARLATAAPLWVAAAALAGALYLAGLLATQDPPRHLLAANGFFLAAPVAILGLLRPRDGDADTANVAAETVQAAVCLYLVAYCLVAPWAGAVSLHWGGRMQFTAYPLLAVLAARTCERWQDAPRRSVRWRPALLVALVAVSCAAQIWALGVLRHKQAFSERLSRTVAAMAPRVVVTNVWWVGHEMYASFFDRTIYYVRTQAQYDALEKALEARGVDSILYAARPLATSPAPGTVHVTDGWGFYALDLFPVSLR